MLYFLDSQKRVIEGNNYYKINIFDKENTQILDFYVKENDKSINFIRNVKTFDDITNKLVFVIKRNKKISFDIK